MYVLKDCEVSRLSIDAIDKFESQIFLILFFHCILAYMYIYKHGTFVYKQCYTLLVNFNIDKLSFHIAFLKTFDKRSLFGIL